MFTKNYFKTLPFDNRIWVMFDYLDNGIFLYK